MDAQWLQDTVGKPLAGGLTKLSFLQVDDPIDFLGNYLIQYADNEEAKQNRSQIKAKIEELEEKDHLNFQLQRAKVADADLEIIEAHKKHEKVLALLTEGSNCFPDNEGSPEAGDQLQDEFNNRVELFINSMKSRIRAKSVYLGKKMPDGSIKYIAGSRTASHMIGQVQNNDLNDEGESQFYPFAVFENVEEEPVEEENDDEEGEEGDSEPSPKPPQRPSFVHVPNVLVDGKMKIHGIPKHGAFLAIHVPSKSYMHSGAVENAQVVKDESETNEEEEGEEEASTGTAAENEKAEEPSETAEAEQASGEQEDSESAAASEEPTVVPTETLATETSESEAAEPDEGAEASEEQPSENSEETPDSAEPQEHADAPKSAEPPAPKRWVGEPIEQSYVLCADTMGAGRPFTVDEINAARDMVLLFVEGINKISESQFQVEMNWVDKIQSKHEETHDTAAHAISDAQDNAKTETKKHFEDNEDASHEDRTFTESTHSLAELQKILSVDWVKEELDMLKSLWVPPSDTIQNALLLCLKVFGLTNMRIASLDWCTAMKEISTESILEAAGKFTHESLTPSEVESFSAQFNESGSAEAVQDESVPVGCLLAIAHAGVDACAAYHQYLEWKQAHDEALAEEAAAAAAAAAEEEDEEEE